VACENCNCARIPADPRHNDSLLASSLGHGLVALVSAYLTAEPAMRDSDGTEW
jgi:hypothetical protein